MYIDFKIIVLYKNEETKKIFDFCLQDVCWILANAAFIFLQFTISIYSIINNQFAFEKIRKYTNKTEHLLITNL